MENLQDPQVRSHGKPDVKLLGVFDNENVIVRLKKLK